MNDRPAISPTIPTASGRDPWGSLLRDGPPPPQVDAAFLAFGQGLLTDDPRYGPANLPPLTN